MMAVHRGNPQLRPQNNPNPYNEVVIDAATYVKHLPFSLEAIIDDDGLHSRFLQAYGLTATDVPLVRLSADGFEQIL